MKKLVVILVLLLLPGLAWADVESKPQNEDISQDNNAADKKTEAEDKPKNKNPDYHIYFLEDMKYCAEHMKLVLHKVSKDKNGKFEDEEHIIERYISNALSKALKRHSEELKATKNLAI